MGKPSSHREPLIGRIIGGRYEVVRVIGKGGMGSIYEVRNTRLGRSFAMKTLTCDAAANAMMLQRFRREADVIARIKHPNIVEIIDWEALDDGSPAMVMEYLRGEDLGARLASGPIAWPFLARVADQMLAALSVAHAGGIVHRDLKPQNVFLATDDAGGQRVKLLDFGVSKVRDSQGLITSDEHLVGTPAYMSPEQADGRASDVGPHSDVWAVGVLLHEMATGALPFNAPSVPSLLYKICHDRPASLLELRPDAPAAFVEVVEASLARAIDRRIADAAALRVRLRDALRDLAGVHFEDELPAVTTVRSDGRTTSSSGAGGAPPADARSAVLTRDIADAATPTMIARRKLAPVALATAGLAAIVVVIAIVVAARDKPARSAEPPPSSAKPGDGDTTVEVVPPPDAEIATGPGKAAGTPAADPAGTNTMPARQVQTPKLTKRRDTGPAVVEPANANPPNTGRPSVPDKKPCAKDDVECLYGDGT